MNRSQCALDRSVSVVITVATFSCFEKPRVSQTSTSRQGENFTKHMLHHHTRCLSKCVPIHTDRRKKPSASERLCNRSRAERSELTLQSHMRSRQTSWCAPSITANAKFRMWATLEIHAFVARLRSPVVAEKSQRSSRD